MIEKLDSFIRRMRWKAFFFDHPETANTSEYNFGFKSEKCPPQHDSLNPFENDLYEMVRSIKFNTSLNSFQNQLKSDAKSIKSSQSLLVPADKTTNLYKVKPESYKKLLVDNVTAKYKKTSTATTDAINQEAKIISAKFDLEDKIEILDEKNAFITLKDHKPNFPNNPKCRLINPSKSEIGKISKSFLDDINSKLRTATGLIQWRNTNDVISWFQNINNKKDCTFLKYDIVDFYPSISENLLSKSLEFAKEHLDIDDVVTNTIYHSRKSLLFWDNNIWMKKESIFDVTMGSYDGAEVAELVGLYLLNKIKLLFDIECSGLYRDDGLIVVKNMPGPSVERSRKQLIKIFADEGLRITTESNLTQTDYLDVTLNLPSGKFWPFRKPNDQPLYINNQSNHPFSIKKQIPEMVSKRISKLSCSKEVFDNTASIYNQALQNSGYTNKLIYNTDRQPPRNKRKRKIIWFNPPYSDSVDTNIGKQFLRLLDKHFPAHHRLHKIFNRNSVKISYSCMRNMATIISNHNKQLLSRPKKPPSPLPCNCRDKRSCPLNGACRQKSIVYKASVKTGNTINVYYGCCATEFKDRFYNHIHTFKHQKKRNNTELSKLIWQSKENGLNPTITWSVEDKAPSYKSGSKRCHLCLSEKLAIIRGPKPAMINSRSEITSKCRHRNKFKLSHLVNAEV